MQRALILLLPWEHPGWPAETNTKSSLKTHVYPRPLINLTSNFSKKMSHPQNNSAHAKGIVSSYSLKITK